MPWVEQCPPELSSTRLPGGVPGEAVMPLRLDYKVSVVVVHWTVGQKTE